MYLLIILLPFLASLASGFFGRKIGVYGAHFINTISITLTTILCILVFFEVGFNHTSVYIKLVKWIDCECFNIFWSFNFDSLTVSMLIPVLIVSCLVHIYSIGYMSHDPHNQRFFSYLSLFTFMMIILVTSDNYLLMFVGWEGVGICSYLLVSFWFTRIAANQSSISALLTNRVGDCFLTIGMFVLIWSAGNIDYATVFALAPFINENIVTIIGICLLIGAMAKSSQIGLHVWLPMAMEGPTPVSALIHAATMVTAGVYLLMRSSPLIEYSSTLLLLSLWIGALTTVFSSLVGLFQQDIKKVIAYSTMSQLGMMVIAIGLSSYNIALYHLVNHAFYKALLFLGAGSVIHAVSDNQDFRKYGGLKPFLPLTYSVMLIASLSLVAFPFMTGFYSKDFILESALGQLCFSSIAVYLIATIGAIFTALYSSKVLYLTFLANPASSKISYKNAHENDIFMTIPLIILAVFSIYFGYITRDLFIGLGFDFYADNALFVHPNHEIMIDTEFAVPSLFKLLPLIFTIISILFALILSEFYSYLLLLFKFNRLGYNIFSLFNQRFYIELFYNKYITDFILKTGNFTTKVIDKGSVELIGPFGLQTLLLFVSNTISNFKVKTVTRLALFILVFAVFYFWVYILFNNNLLILILFSLIYLTCFNSNNNNHDFVFPNINYKECSFFWYKTRYIAKGISKPARKNFDCELIYKVTPFGKTRLHFWSIENRYIRLLRDTIDDKGNDKKYVRFFRREIIQYEVDSENQHVIKETLKFSEQEYKDFSMILPPMEGYDEPTHLKGKIKKYFTYFSFRTNTYPFFYPRTSKHKKIFFISTLFGVISCLKLSYFKLINKFVKLHNKRNTYFKIQRGSPEQAIFYKKVSKYIVYKQWRFEKVQNSL